MAAVLLYVCSAFVVWVCCFKHTVQAESVKCPSSCTCLGSVVDCSKIGLVNIPKDIPRWVTRLEIVSNSIVEIRHDDLKGLHNLQYLDLSKNELKSIDGSAFGDLTSLTQLRLDFNQLTEIPRFSRHLNITELSMTDNHVVSISISALSQLPHLQSLDLSNNLILSITNGSFPGPSKLTHLNMDNNQIAAVEMGSMANLTALLTLKLNKNKLTDITPGAFIGMNVLKTLELMRNKIKIIRWKTFHGLKRLTSLKLKKNEISILRDGAFYNLSVLRNLQLDNNNLVNITKAWIYGLQRLKILSLTYNKIDHIEPDAWEQCKNLEKLYLTGNQLTTITESNFAHLTSLSVLVLDHNLIARIDDGAFGHLADLTTLEINSNQLGWTMVDAKIFRGLTSLTRLSLKSNSIRSIAMQAFYGLTKLRQLYLEDNDITAIQENAFEHLRDLRDLRFNSSKFYCDCDLKWLNPWLKMTGFQNSAIGTCHHPSTLRDRPLVLVDAVDFKCNNTEFPKPYIIESPQTTNAFKDGNLTLTCQAAVTGNTQPNIQWKKDNVLLDETYSFITASSDGDTKRYTSHLVLLDVQDSMAGRYHCVVSNEFGIASSQWAQIQVYVYPVFTLKPEDVTVKAGKPAELKCAATGQPTPEISWQKDGGDSFPAARERRMHVYPSDDRFYIMATSIADEGVYSCMARNEAGVIISNATVTVLETPDFVQPMLSKKATKKGETTVLQCMASGNPPPKLTWLKDDKELVRTPRHFVTVDSQLLVIVDTQWSDAGIYACRMSNSLGTAKGTTELQVLSPSGDVSGPGGNSFGLDDESTTTGIIIIAVVCCVVGTSLVWVIIIYQTRKRHEGYSATPTEETTLPGEVPSSGYMSSDKEGSYSQGPLTIPGFHYQTGDYQMKESGYESSSGQFRANGYNRPAIVPSGVDEDDHHPPTMTAGDRLLCQLKRANSVSSLQYAASDGDTIESRHSTSSGQHSGSSDPPSSHSGHQKIPASYHQLHVVTDEFKRNPTSPAHSPASDDQSDQHHTGSPDVRSLFQTFHPTKPTNHNRLCGSTSAVPQREEGGDRHRLCCDSCDSREVESSSSLLRHPHADDCAAVDNSSACGRAATQPEAQHGNVSSCCLRGKDSDGSKRRPNCCVDQAGNNCRHFDSKHMPSHPSGSSHSSLSHLPAEIPCKLHCKSCVNSSQQSHARTLSDSPSCSQHGAVSSCDCCDAGSSVRRTNTPSYPCCCEVVRDPCYCPHQQCDKDDSASVFCSNCDSHAHSNHHVLHHKPPQHLGGHGGQAVVNRPPCDPRVCCGSTLSPAHSESNNCGCESKDVAVQSCSFSCSHVSHSKEKRNNPHSGDKAHQPTKGRAGQNHSRVSSPVKSVNHAPASTIPVISSSHTHHQGKTPNGETA